MKIKIIQNCFIAGKAHIIGDLVEVGDQNARELIQMERAVPHRAEAKAPVSAPAQEQKREDRKRG